MRGRSRLRLMLLLHCCAAGRFRADGNARVIARRDATAALFVVLLIMLEVATATEEDEASTRKSCAQVYAEVGATLFASSAACTCSAATDRRASKVGAAPWSAS